MIIFDKQFKTLLEDIRILVSKTDNHVAKQHIEDSLKQYALKNLMPEDYVVSNFYTFARIPYGDKIMKMDEGFFMNLDESELISDKYKKESNESITLLTSIFRDIWGSLDEPTKSKIWTRLQILVKLSDKWHNEQ